jgi:SAM-dependent methyltransferase
MPVNENAEYMLVQLLEAERANTCGEESRQNYVDLRKVRFADILRLCRSYVPDPSARVLDIGRSELTAYLLNFYQNIHTLGLDTSIDDGGHREVSKMDTLPHITFDLLSSHTVSNWPDCGRFDLIVFSEVIEHLWVAPEFVFAALHSFLADSGILICTTPNAADIAKRLRLYSINPGHVREYTRQELCEIAHSVGLKLQKSFLLWIQNRGGNRIKAIIMKLLRMYPPFRSFQVCVLERKTAVMAGL